MKLLRIKPSTIKVPEVRVTAKFDQETRELLSQSIKGSGILSPVLVQKIDNEIVLIDGLHRMQDAIAAGDQPIDVAVLDGDMVDLLCRNVFLDKIRGKPPIADMVLVIEALYKEYNQDPDQISEKTGLPRDYIEKLIKISTASPEVREALDQEAIGVGVAYELSRLPYNIQQEEILAKTTVYRLRVKDIKDLVDATLAAMEETTTTPAPVTEHAERPPIEIHCECCKKKVEPSNVRPALVCPDCFGRIWKMARAEQEQAEEIEVEAEGA